MKLCIAKKLWLLVPVFLLLSCSKEEDNSSLTPPAVEDGYALIRLRMDMPVARTYTGARFMANTAEKEIRSIAIFTTRYDENLRVDIFNKFFSTDGERTATSLYEPLTGSPGSYSAAVKLAYDESEIENKVDVFIIANYEENGLTQKLKAINSYNELSEIRTEPVRNGILTPLLMIGEHRVTLTNGGTAKQSFDLYRLASRVDVENHASAAGFTLTQARLINTRVQTYIGAGHPNKILNAILERGEFVNANSGPEPDPLAVKGLYTYETDNSIPVIATAVLVRGTINGYQYEKTVQLKHADEDNVPGGPIALERNYRYVVKIVANKATNQIVYDIGIAPWVDGTVIEARPTLELPELFDFKFQDNDLAEDWDAKKRIYFINRYAHKTMSFTVRSLTTTEYSVSYKYADSTTVKYLFGFSDTNGLRVYREDPVVTYAQVEQRYTVTIPTPVVETNGPAAIVLSIVNPLDRALKADITLVYMSQYRNTNEYPVIVDGLFWAPVNEGAASVGTNAATEHMGRLYQFGRNGYRGEYYVGSNPHLVVTKLIQSHISYDLSVSSTHNIFFILTSTNLSTDQQYDWLTRTTAQHQQRLDDWRDGQGPCPDGWKVPSKAQLDRLQAKLGNAPRVSNNRVAINGDYEGYTLYLPMAGYREYNGSFYNRGTHGYYYSHEYNSVLLSNNRGSKPWVLSITNGSAAVNGALWGGAAASVRCVYNAEF